ncbi:MAG TPA: hypothetical protein VFS40_13855 [Gemmatimonadales bacterium]|nr:hypothetical protein [Gemmatimonadales bacterium]
MNEALRTSHAIPAAVDAAIDEANVAHRHETWYALRDAMRELRALGLVAPPERPVAALRVVEYETTLRPYGTILLAFADRLVAVRQLEQMRGLERVRGLPLGGEIDVTIVPLTEVTGLRARRPFLGAALTLVLATRQGRRCAWTVPDDQRGAVLEHFLHVARAALPAPSAPRARRPGFYPSRIPGPRAA